MIPEKMTPRARLYIAITAIQHGLVGLAALILHQQFNGQSFVVARDLFPIQAWGAVFFIGSLYLAVAAVKGEEDWARVGMVVSVVLTAIWAVSFALSYLEGAETGLVSPVGTVLALALMAKDLVVCRQPMCSPFEVIVNQYAPRTR